MAYKKATKEVGTTGNVAALPSNTDEIFKLKIDREHQKFFIDGQDKFDIFDEVLIRPLDILTKIVSYDDNFEVKCESTLYHELKEATDTWGNSATDKAGKVCGRVIWKNLMKDWSDEQKSENKEKAKFYAMIFGIATIGKHEPILVDFRVGGTKFMDLISIMKKIKEEKKEYNKAELKIKAYKSKDFDWPELEFMPDFSRELPVAGISECLDTVEGFIEDHNHKIIEKAEKFKAWKSKNSSYKKTN